MTETLYHGSHRGELVLHLGLCLTSDEDAARVYGGYDDENVYGLTLDLTGLTVLHVDTDDDAYDRDEQRWPGDDNDPTCYGDADVIVYDDEDECGNRHDTYRLLTPAALAAIS